MKLHFTIPRLASAAFVFASIASIASASAGASARTFAISLVSASVPRGAVGDDAGIDVAGGRYVRLTASGAVNFGTYSACGGPVGPAGCTRAFSFAKLAPNAPTGALIVAFVDASGRQVTSWAPAGDAAFVIVPHDAARMMLRVNGSTGRERGRFRVAADVVSSGSAASTGTTVGTGVRRFTLQRVAGSAPTFTRVDAQHLLRRFGFSDTPAEVTAVLARGAKWWLTEQLNPASIDDSDSARFVQAMPVITGISSQDDDFYATVPRRIVQREVASKRQLLEKLTLHWLEHFSISEDKVQDLGAMAHYEDTVRADALGNFATLVSDVSKEPAMLYWLDNNYNYGSDPVHSPPNENFGRELMQLYTLGETKLNPDGSTVVDASNNPVPNYAEADVKAVALALTGFQVYSPYPQPTGVDPRTFDKVMFNKQAHGAGPYSIVGTQVADLGNPAMIPRVVSILAHMPSTAPFEVKELLQRFVTEDPSPGYIARVSAVWSANLDDPNQIAKVVAAIADDPEFYTSTHSMVKEPIEFSADAIRALNGAQGNVITSFDPTPLDFVEYDDGQMSQVHYYPPSVFSFYRPGDKDSLITNSELLSRWDTAVDISYGTRVNHTCPKCQVNLQLQSLASASPDEAAQYMLDALVDGGNPELHALVTNYLTGQLNYSGAVWIILTSPEYEVN